MTLPCYHYADSYHYSQTSSVKMSKNGIFSRRCCCQGLSIKNFYADLFSSSNVSICSSASRNFTLIVMRLSSCTKILSIKSISMGNRDAVILVHQNTVNQFNQHGTRELIDVFILLEVLNKSIAFKRRIIL